MSSQEVGCCTANDSTAWSMETSVLEWIKDNRGGEPMITMFFWSGEPDMFRLKALIRFKALIEAKSRINDISVEKEETNATVLDDQSHPKGAKGT